MDRSGNPWYYDLLHAAGSGGAGLHGQTTLIGAISGSAERQVAGDGQYQDAPLVEREGHPHLVVKSHHNHSSTPQDPLTSKHL